MRARGWWAWGLCGATAFWPVLVCAQLVVRDVQGPPLPNPANGVPYPHPGFDCNDTLADIGARAVVRALDRCPQTFIDSRQAYLSYAKQAALGLAIPGVAEASAALAIDKAAENVFFCLSGALIDESGGSDADKEYAKALLAAAKEYVDRADFVVKANELRTALVQRQIAPYLAGAEGNTFVQTLDATLTERAEALFGKANPDGAREPGVDVGLVQAGSARLDTPQARAEAATEQARALARDCRYPQADAALAAAQQLNLSYLATLRRDVVKARHHRQCVETSALQQRRTMADSLSPFLRHSLSLADADIADAEARDAEQTRFIGQIEDLHRSVRARSNDVAFLRKQASSQLETARQAIAECNFDQAARLLETVDADTLECALELDAIRQEHTTVSEQIAQARQQLADLEAEFNSASATPFAEVFSCGQYTLLASDLDQRRGQCRVLAGIDAKVAALRERARACNEFRSGQSVGRVVHPPPPPGTPATPVSGAFGPPTTRFGSYPPAFENHEKKLYGTMGPRLAQTTAEWVPVSVGMARITHTYAGNLPDILRPGDIIELSCTSEGMAAGTSPPYWGSSCLWTVEGSVETLEAQKGAFAGIGSDGKLYPSATSTLRFRVGSGGQIIIRATQHGYTWGAGSENGNPAEYIYAFVP